MSILKWSIQMSPIVVAVLVPPIHSNVPSPKYFPIAKAIQDLGSEGIITVFGFDLHNQNNTVWINGKKIINNNFIDFQSKINIIYDRFPSQLRHAHFQALQAAASTTPWGNPYSTTLLCRDKLRCQQILENKGIRMPEVIDDHRQFDEILYEWEYGFIKPQFGALGKGVRAVYPNGQIPLSVEGVVPNQLEPTILQRGIKPPSGWAGMSVRQLMQKDINGSWIARTAVLRRSKEELVVNVARGAEAVPAIDFLPTATVSEIKRQSLLACSILDSEPNGHYNVEFGLDFVIDPEFMPWLIEANSRPRGRLEHLAMTNPDRFSSEHEASCIQPIRYLASLCS